MLSILVLVLVVAVLVALGLVFGGAFLVLFLVLAALAAAAWAFRFSAARRDAATEVQGEERPGEVETPELLGPGGPDDPRPS